MIVISPFFINPLFIAAMVFSGWQHVRLQRPNPVLNRQFATMVFCMVMMLVTIQNNRDNPTHHPNPWVSLVLLLLGIVVLTLAVRQNRMVPPRRRT
jgi:peptidoglycan/LPS O-acetylase OafA/YrhL